MNRRTTTTFNTLAITIIAALLLVPIFILGQGPATATKSQPAAAPAAKAPAAAAKAWVTPRTPDGQPDLQGYWTNATYNQLERAVANANKPFFTKEEFDERVRRAALTDEQQTTPGTTGDVHYDFTQFGLDKSQNAFVADMRTGMITDPPDGRIPAQTAEAKKRTADRAAAYRANAGAQGDSVLTIPIGSRCIIYNPPPGPPMLPQGYNGNYQIIQSRDSLMILFEQIGDIRIVYLDGRPAPPANIRLTMGASRGHWEGDTLVVETTNFSDRPQARNAALSGISDNFKLIEKFKRTGENSFDYEFTVNDPATFEKPWTASMPFTRIKGPIFEAACHEGNYGIEDTLKGYRALDGKPAEAVAPAAPRGGGRGAPPRGQ